MRPRRGYPPASHAWQCPAPTTQEAAARALRPVRRARADAPRGDARGGARAALAERGEPGQRDGETRMEQPVARWEMLHRRLGADDRCSSLAGDSYVKYCDLGDSITTVLSRGGVLTSACCAFACTCIHPTRDGPRPLGRRLVPRRSSRVFCDSVWQRQAACEFFTYGSYRRYHMDMAGTPRGGPVVCACERSVADGDRSGAVVLH